MSPLLDTLGRLHPLVLHLPIGVLVGLAAWELVRAGLKRRSSKGWPLGPAPVFLAWLATLGSAAAIATGLAHELELGPDPATTLHKWTSIAAGISALFTAAAATALASAESRAPAKPPRRASTAYRLILFITLAILVPAGHFGATITHGEGFLLAPLFDSSRPAEPTPSGTPDAPIGPNAPPTTPATDPTLLAVQARRILAARCESCHGPTRSRGQLRVDSTAALLTPKDDGQPLVPGDPAASLIIQRLRRPLDARGHMPPRSEPQPTEDEIAALEAWILNFSMAPSEQPEAIPGVAGVPPATRERETPAPSGPDSQPPALIDPPAPVDLPEPPPPDPTALAALRTRLIHAQPLAANSNLLWIDLSSLAQADDTTVTQLLLPLRHNIADLSLARTAITDSTLALIADMPRLARLNLSSAAITDSGLEYLAAHARLDTLILTDTAITDAAAPTLASMPALRRVYLWNTAITDESLDWLALARPELEVDTGDAGSDPLETEPEPVIPAPP